MLCTGCVWKSDSVCGGYKNKKDTRRGPTSYFWKPQAVFALGLCRWVTDGVLEWPLPGNGEESAHLIDAIAGFHLGLLGTVLVRVSLALIKQQNKKQLGEKRA